MARVQSSQWKSYDHSRKWRKHQCVQKNSPQKVTETIRCTYNWKCKVVDYTIFLVRTVHINILWNPHIPNQQNQTTTSYASQISHKRNNTHQTREKRFKKISKVSSIHLPSNFVHDHTPLPNSSNRTNYQIPENGPAQNHLLHMDDSKSYNATEMQLKGLLTQTCRNFHVRQWNGIWNDQMQGVFY